MDQLWIEPLNGLIAARVRGVPTDALLQEMQQRILQLVKETNEHRVLYDALEMEPPPVSVPLSQWRLDAAEPSVKLKRAIVVPNTKLAYLARLAFTDGDYRVFYNDLAAAVVWLTDV